MNRRSAVSSGLAVTTLFTAFLVNAQRVPAVKTNPAFEGLKSLAGAWEGQSSNGATATVEYQIVSNGSAIMERLHPHDELEMITMYSADGQRVSATHYCNVGNQPQMQTAELSGSPQKLTFNYVRATNLAGDSDGHMAQLTLVLLGPNHLDQEWNFAAQGHITQTELFHFTRSK